MSVSGEAMNTDKKLWQESPDGHYSDSIHVTQSGAIGINCGGTVIVAPVRKWYESAREIERLEARVQELEQVIREYKAEPVDLRDIRAETLADSTKEELHDSCCYFMRKLTEIEQEHDRLRDDHDRMMKELADKIQAGLTVAAENARLEARVRELEAERRIK